MATMTIRNIDEQLKSRLRVRAAMHGRSMEDEAREILRASLSVEASRQSTLFTSIRARLLGLEGVELLLPERDACRPPPSFDP